MMIAAWLLWVAATAYISHAELTLDIYGNSAMHGKAESTQKLSSLDFALPLDRAYSAEVTGQLVYDASDLYAFDCSFSHAQVAIVWIDDHLVCNTRPPFGATPSSTDGTPMYPLRGSKEKAVPLVIHIYNSLTNATAGESLTISVKWMRLKEAVPASQAPRAEQVPGSALLPGLPKLELQRRELQQSLRQGWNTWSYNMLGVVKLPESCDVTTALCKKSTGECLLDTFIEDPAASIRVGMFATDLSYWQFYLGFKGLNVSMSYSGGHGLSWLAEPVNCDSVDCSDYAIVVLPSFKWERVGSVSVAQDNASISFSPLGMEPIILRMTRPGIAMDVSKSVPDSLPHIVLPLGQGAVGFQANTAAMPVVADVRTAIQSARAREVARLEKFTGDKEGGDLYTTKEGLQAATMWNYIYTPAEYGPILPVSRSWDFVTQPMNDDWAYVIFDWDNIFASYMTSLDPTGKDIAYSNLIQVIRSRTAKGFVPNYAAAGRKSVDRTEPPIGAKVLLEMYDKYGDLWLVDLLYDDLLEWNNWFLRERILQPLGLIALGSDYISNYSDFSANAMQGARFESGLDNSPMYDGDFFDNSTHLMQLYDVGMSSMFVQEAVCLAALARLLGRSGAEQLEARAASMRKLIATHLWDEAGGIFTNKFANGSFYRKISPTSFYAMLAGAATDKQAEDMVQNWLMSPEHFCIAPNGDFAGNKDTCYWGLPSIQAADPTFPPLGYWRGYVWGPMAQLTFWSLQYYDHVPAVRQGRKALCKQMNSLMLWQWRKNRHICENYSPHRTADDHSGDCSGTKFYHWGALTGMISLIEQGYYAGTQPTSESTLLI
eukprot:gb/GFBE01060778.1/.p1 GENE.gb/GFBE01060778.1/~~gb/GFBE01060778.1/.p1  ORF type:complete len:828 (+),score=155.91 gb/GFBE01060778.1/:1-2484(+)